MPENSRYIVSSDEKGSVNICQSVVAVIAAAEAIDVDGVHALYQSHGKEMTSVSGKKGLSRGIKTVIDGETISVDVNIITEIGHSVNEVGEAVQKAVKSAIEEAVGIDVKGVNVNICGVSLKRPKQPVQ